ncbi:hypothetical protein MHI24_28675 [Paenibacillus sp. FSL K6-1096]|uniref:hypothetical protein n=1 Tax=Paenibacillus sp. FSL K6-1096 TaxID=2921460 RepID=UPI0030ECD0CA
MRNNWRKIVLALVVCLLLGGGVLYGNMGSEAEPAAQRLRLSGEEPVRYLQGPDTVTVDQLELTLGQQNLPDKHISIPNHTEVLWRKPVTAPAGEGELIKFIQEGSAALPAPAVTYYWLCVQRPDKHEQDLTVTYYIEAKVLGEDDGTAEAKLLKLAEHWEILD